MDVNDNRQSPYANPEFWKAYAALYWPELDHNEPLTRFAKTLATSLPKVADEDAPLRVLALGFGFGGVELPILYHLKDITKRRLECVAVDSIPEPMHFASHLLARGIDRLPKTASELELRFESGFRELPRAAVEYAPGKNTFFRSAEKGALTSFDAAGDRYHFIWDDLDWEPFGDSMCQDGNPIELPVCPTPSCWADRLRDKQSRRESHLPQQFDMVIAAFSLFHIKWWRRPLYASFDMLTPGGLFLHAKVSGDEAIFEGRHGKLRSNNSNAVAVFLDGLFKDPRVQKISSKPRGASASRPFVVEEYLRRLEAFGMDPIPGLDGQATTYSVANTVQTAVYRALLTTKGFSTFRRIAESMDRLHPSAYTALCNDILNRADASAAGYDQLDIDYVWSVHRVSPKELKKCPLHPEFTMPAPRRDAALAAAYQAEYAMNGAASIHVEADDDDHCKVARTIGSKLAQQELLDSRCIALQLGFIPQNESRPHFFFLPSFKLTEFQRNKQLRQLALYLSLLKQSRQLDNSSNTQKLINVVLTLFPAKPAIFVYELNKDHLGVTHRSARDYEEIRFQVPARDADDAHFIQQLAFEWMSLIERTNPSNEVVSSLDVDPPDLRVSTPAMEKQLGSLFALMKTKMTDPRYIDALPNSMSSCASLSPEARSRMVKVCQAPRTLFGALSLQCLDETEMVVFYPATYDVGEHTSARDLVIASYSERLADDDIERELHKYSQVFERIRFKRQKDDAIERGMEKGIAAVEQRFGHELAKSFGPVLSVISKCDNSHIAFGTQLAQAALTYGTISTPSKFAVALCEQMPPVEVMRLAWRIHILRDVLGETLSDDLLATCESEITYLWGFSPPLDGALLGDCRGIRDNIVVRLYQLQYIMLINGLKHHYRYFYSDGDDASARVNRLAVGLKAETALGAVKVSVDIANAPHSTSKMLTIEITNSVSPHWHCKKWSWRRGTPQALDSTCAVIHEELHQPYDRTTAIAFHQKEETFSCRCAVPLPIAPPNSL